MCLIEGYDQIKYLVLFGLEKYDVIHDRIRSFIRLKSDITYVYFYNYAKIKIDSIGGLSL